MNMSTVSSVEAAQFKGFAPGLDGANAEALADELGARFVAAREAISNFVFGQKTVVDQVLITLLGCDPKPIQFTPDLMRGDIVGSEVLEEADDGRRAFRFIKGPVFCQLLMADEINRASPRTQSD